MMKKKDINDRESLMKWIYRHNIKNDLAYIISGIIIIIIFIFPFAGAILLLSYNFHNGGLFSFFPSWDWRQFWILVRYITLVLWSIYPLGLGIWLLIVGITLNKAKYDYSTGALIAYLILTFNYKLIKYAKITFEKQLNEIDAKNQAQ